jgi:hypothetical protein
VVDQTRWRADPDGMHESRFFTADGRPTNLVMDGGETSYDRRQRAEPQPAQTSPVVTEVNFTPDWTSEPESEPSPVFVPSGTPIDLGANEPVSEPTAGRASAPVAVPESSPVVTGPLRSVSDVERAWTPPTDPLPREVEQSAGVHQPPGIAVPVVDDSDADRTASARVAREAEPFSRTVKLAYVAVCAMLALSALGLLYVHVKPSRGHPTHAAAPTTTTSAPATTTTVALPTALKPGAEDAATALVSNWAAGNRAAALTVATPAGVTALFATPYTSGLAIDRGCSTSFSPIVCTFGPPGGASPTDPIYEIDVTQAPGGWYVSSVRTEN